MFYRLEFKDGKYIIQLGIVEGIFNNFDISCKIKQKKIYPHDDKSFGIAILGK